MVTMVTSLQGAVGPKLRRSDMFIVSQSERPKLRRSDMFIVKPIHECPSPVGAAWFHPRSPLPLTTTCRPYGAWGALLHPVSINMLLLRSLLSAFFAFSVATPFVQIRAIRVSRFAH